MEELPIELVRFILRLRSDADQQRRDGLMKQVCRLWCDLLTTRPMCPGLQLESESLWRWAGAHYTTTLLSFAARQGDLGFIQRAFRDGALRAPHLCQVHRHDPISGEVICFRKHSHEFLSEQKPRICGWSSSLWQQAALAGRDQVLRWIETHLSPPNFIPDVLRCTIRGGHRQTFQIFCDKIPPTHLIKLGFLDSLNAYLKKIELSFSDVDHEFVIWALKKLPPFPRVNSPLDYLENHAVPTPASTWSQLLVHLGRHGFVDQLFDYLSDECHDPRSALMGLISCCPDHHFHPKRVVEWLCSDTVELDVLPFLFDHVFMLSFLQRDRTEVLVDLLQRQGFFVRHPQMRLSAMKCRFLFHSLIEMGNLDALKWLALPVDQRPTLPGSLLRDLVPSVPWNLLRPRALWIQGLQARSQRRLELMSWVQDQVRRLLELDPPQVPVFGCDLDELLAMRPLFTTLSVELLRWCIDLNHSGALDLLFTRTTENTEMSSRLCLSCLRWGRVDLLDELHTRLGHHALLAAVKKHLDSHSHWAEFCRLCSDLVSSLKWLRDTLSLTPPPSLLTSFLDSHSKNPVFCDLETWVFLIDFIHRILGVSWENEETLQRAREELAYDPHTFPLLKTTSCVFPNEHEEEDFPDLSDLFFSK